MFYFKDKFYEFFKMNKVGRVGKCREQYTLRVLP